MKVLVLTPVFPPEIGGPATYTREFALRSAKRGHEVGIIALSDGPLDALPSIKVQAILRKPFLIRELKVFLKTLRLAKEADIIYALNPIALGLPALLVSWLSGKPFILRFVGDTAWERASRIGQTEDSFEDYLRADKGLVSEAIGALQALVLKNADKVLTPSSFMAEMTAAHYGISKSKFMVVRNALDEKEYRYKDGARLKAKIRLSGTNILTVCRLIPLKQVDKIIRAMPLLIAKHPDLRLLVIGDGPERPTLRALVKELSLEDSIEFLGRLPHGKVIEYMAASDLFLLNSTHETFPTVLLEALACGTPALANPVGGIPEIEGVSFIDPNKPLEESIGEALAGSGPDAGDEARRILNTYSWDAVLDKTWSLFAKLKRR